MSHRRAARVLATGAVALGPLLLVLPQPASAAPAPFQPKIDKAVRDPEAKLAERPECSALLSGGRLSDRSR